MNAKFRMVRVSFTTTGFGRTLRAIGIKITSPPRKNTEVGMVTDTRMTGGGETIGTPRRIFTTRMRNAMLTSGLVATVVNMHRSVTPTPQHMTRNMYVQLEHLGGAFD